ncbi:MAG TPA: TolC family protein, partial [Candidatus Polarisedimenticolia bacterium]|nr:TolC family protein [Candidatus Polarisedimenticolia bacterium]
VAGFDLANPNREILPPEPDWKGTWDAAVMLELSLYDGGRAAAETAQASALAEAARQSLQELDRSIRLEVVRGLTEVSTAAASLSVAERSLESARENARVAADRHRAGVAPSSERLDAEAAVLRAGLDRTEARAGVRLAEAALQRALGR